MNNQHKLTAKMTFTTLFNGYAAHFLIKKDKNAYDPAAVMVSFHLNAVFMEIYTVQCIVAV